MTTEKYANWQASLMEDTKKKLFKTIGNLLDESNGELTQDELTRLNLCWDIVRDMAHIVASEKSVASETK